MLFYYVFLVYSIDERNFKQCEQVPFCRRNRELTKQYWQVLRKTEMYDENYFLCQIHEQIFDKTLIFKLYFLKNSIRYTIGPSESEKFRRYELSKDYTVFNKTTLNKSRKYSYNNNLTDIFFKVDDLTVTVKYKPFSSTIMNKNGKITTINPNDNAVFEHNIDKTKFPSMFYSSDFNGHVDKIPNGPTGVAMDIYFHGNGIKFYGLPEHTLNLSLPFTMSMLKSKEGIDYQSITDPIRLFNVDANSYEVNSPMSLYGSIPFLIGKDLQKTSAIFWANPSETWVDLSQDRFGSNSRFMSEGGYIDFFVFTGNKPADVLKAYTELTGKPSLPQSFALGYHQSKWGYKSIENIKGVMKGFDEVQIPFESIWLDLDHTDDRMYFTFHPINFKGIESLQDEIDPLERKLVALIDPHLKVSDEYYVYEQALNSKFLIYTGIGNEYTGECWPGLSTWVDFLNPHARMWWETLYDYKIYKGSTLTLQIWNDMNEPSVFNIPDGTIPRDTLHYNDIENREVHNIYGHLMISATHGGLMKRNDDDDDRPFILTRSFFAGSQKYAFTWTGDNTASWEHMAYSISMILTLSISGMPFCGADVGGFFNDPTSSLLIRWYQLASWCYPFFRAHSHHNSKDREPYLFKNEIGESIKRAILDRYLMFPYWYTLARHSNVSGSPIVRPLWYEFYNDRRFSEVDNRFMLGSAILVIPVLEDDCIKIFTDLPNGRWYNFRTLKEISSEKIYEFSTTLSEIPVLIRGGFIVPMNVWRRRTIYLQRNDPITLIVAIDSEGSSSGDLYIDDQQTQDFMKGFYIHRKFIYSNYVLSSKPYDNMQISNCNFYRENRVTIEKIKVLGLKQQPLNVTKNGLENVETEWDENNYVLILHRVNLSIKTNWFVKFEYTKYDTNKENVTSEL